MSINHKELILSVYTKYTVHGYILLTNIKIYNFNVKKRKHRSILNKPTVKFLKEAVMSGVMDSACVYGMLVSLLVK